MIFALRQPTILLGLLLGFVVGVVLRAVVQRRVAAAGSPGRARLRSVGATRRGLRFSGGWAAYLDPYGTVAAILSGAGWGVRPEVRRRNGDVLLLLAAVGVHGVLAAAGLAAFVAAGGPREALHVIDVTEILHGSLHVPDAGQAVALGFGMVNLACGLLALLPIPPLELGVVLWSRLPRSPGARRMAYRVLEEQWGVAVVLLLLLLPLAGQQPVLLALIDIVGGDILGAV